MSYDLKNGLDKLKKQIQKIKQAECMTPDQIYSIYSLHEELALELVLSKNTPESVKEYLSDYENKQGNLPPKYQVLDEYNSLIDELRPKITDKINETIKKDGLSNIIEIISTCSLFNYNHLHSVTKIEKRILKHKIFTPLIKLYKELFYRTSSVKYLERIGDLYVKLNDYDNAIESYLNFAEVSEPSAKIYIKMAKVFSELKDVESRNMCIEQAKILEGNNV